MDLEWAYRCIDIMTEKCYDGYEQNKMALSVIAVVA
jgi:hypothetical protein